MSHAPEQRLGLPTSRTGALRERPGLRRMLRRLTPRSLKNKLALLFFAITAAAFGLLFFFVVPQLESRLVEERLAELERVTRATVPPLEAAVVEEISERQINERVRATADEADAIVTVLAAQRSGAAGSLEDVRPYVVSDSRAEEDIDEPLALASRVFLSGREQRGTETIGGERIARVAQPIRVDGEVAWVGVWSRSIDEVAETVGLIRTQVVVATALALLVALVGGYLVAQALSRRVGRLEAAAERVAAGRFTGPLPIDSDDELGQLTSTFNEMQAQLARVDRARKDFIATASHELRTPIMSLAGFVELLEDEELDPQTREEFLGTMREQVERLQKLAVDLLDLSRLDAGSLDLHRTRVDVGALGRAVVTEFAPALKAHAVELELRLAAGVEAVCDRERVAQIMRILLDNALRHTPDGTPVAVTVDRRDGCARFSVADRGPGLDQDAVERIFERFYTADAARGSGLGLAIAKELAEVMNGRIGVRSWPGETVFTFELPGA